VTGRTVRSVAGLLVLAAISVPAAMPAAPPSRPSHGLSTGTRPPQVPATDASQQPRPTDHAPLPASLGEYWLVPPAGWAPGHADTVSAARSLAHAAALIGEEKYAQALPFIRSSALAGTPLAGYAAYLTGLAELELDRIDDARRTFAALRAAKPAGYLAEAATLQLAEASTTQRDYAAAVALYEELLAQKPASPDDVLLRLARAASSAGDRVRALEAYQTLYYDWPTSEGAAAAEQEMPLSALEPITPGSPRFARELARAERLFAERRFAPAREAFDRLAATATGDQAELVQLRLVESDYYLRRYQRVREDLKPFLDRASRRAEARFFYLMTTRAAGSRDEYIALTRALVDEFPSSSWAEDALNNLASFHIVNDEDDQADAVLRELASRFPSGRYTARALWKIGWRAYRQARYAEAAEVFERAAVAFPRSDYRPSYLYWAARSRQQAGDAAASDAGLQLVVTDYANSYYGRLATAALKAKSAAIPPSRLQRLPAAAGGPADASIPPTADLIRWLISLEMYDEALDEVLYAERTWGGSPSLGATRAWLLNRTGELRPAITLMRQTYPQFLAAGGESMPPEIVSIIFPLQHWPLISQHAAAHGLDPYLVAALIAQESTFDKDIVSAAKAIGLMQIMPTTGRRWARRLGIRNYSTRKLTVPEINVRIGTAYFADLVKQFGSVHAALAAYNAGEGRVVKWQRDRPGLPTDEFIDDIPFPETQTYVRRILGTAEDYRRLYGPAGGGNARRAPAAGRQEP
jgi:soluble lytic murein transglycosylase